MDVQKECFVPTPGAPPTGLSLLESSLSSSYCSLARLQCEEAGLPTPSQTCHPLCTDAQLGVEQCCALGVLCALLAAAVQMPVSCYAMPAIVAALGAPAIALDAVQFVLYIHAMRGSRLAERTNFAVAAAAAGKMLCNCECCNLLVGHVCSPCLFGRRSL